jgi:Putative Ig domain
MSDAAVFDPATARWLVQLGKRLENSQVLNPGYIEQLALKTMPRFSGGSDVRYFVLAEDAVEIPVYAYPGELNETTGDIDIVADTDPFELYYSNQCLSSPDRAQSGYSGHYGTDDGGRKIFTFGPCISGCTTSASITPGTPPAGTVGVAYSHTVTKSGLNGSGIAATGLPAGLSINSGTGAITGTPTTAGTYWVAFTGTSTDTPACNLTRVAKIVIAEAA